MTVGHFPPPASVSPHAELPFPGGQELAVTGCSPWSSVRDQGTPRAWGFGVTFMIPGDKADPQSHPEKGPSCRTEHPGAPKASLTAWDPRVLCPPGGLWSLPRGSRSGSTQAETSARHTGDAGGSGRDLGVWCYCGVKTEGSYLAAPLCPSVCPSVHRW